MTTSKRAELPWSPLGSMRPSVRRGTPPVIDAQPPAWKSAQIGDVCLIVRFEPFCEGSFPGPVSRSIGGRRLDEPIDAGRAMNLIRAARTRALIGIREKTSALDINPSLRAFD